MRINKFIAQSGETSRRKADELIAEGRVKVNRVTLNEPGYDVVEGDVVEVDGRVIGSAEKKVYYLLNKPVGYVTTVSDDKERYTVMDLMSDVEERVFPVGRLDYNTSGMMRSFPESAGTIIMRNRATRDTGFGISQITNLFPTAYILLFIRRWAPNSVLMN